MTTRAKFILLAAFGAVAALFMAGCSCEQGSICGDGNIVGASASPSPTPVLLGTPDPCQIKAVSVGIYGGGQVEFLPLGQILHLDATPKNDSGVIPDGCNVTREPTWNVLTPLTCQIFSSGSNAFNPFLRGLRVGSCSVTAMVSQVTSVPFSIEVR